MKQQIIELKKEIARLKIEQNETNGKAEWCDIDMAISELRDELEELENKNKEGD